MRRVAVTGLGVLSAVGNDPETFFANLFAGVSGVGFLKQPFPKALACPFGASVRFEPREHFAEPALSLLDRFAQLGVVAARQAWKNARLDSTPIPRDRIGVCWGTGLGGAQTIEDEYHQEFLLDNGRVKPYTVLRTMCNSAGSHISIEFGLKGPTLTYSVACASSAIAIGEALRLIRHGYAEAMMAGGSEAFLTYGSLKAWGALRTLALPDQNDVSASCKPFDRRRTGLVLGEGAAAVVLEDFQSAVQRGVPVLCELVGYGLSSDATHISSPDADGQARAMRAAMDDGRVSPEDIQHVNAHGTATSLGDRVETRALKNVFGSRAGSLMISATKSMHGHVMGATGAVEFVATVMATYRQCVPPTAHLCERDPECDLDYVPLKGRTGAPILHAMSNSFAFGGTNAVLIVRRAGARP
jgi:3-oxoacyl-[acyl-carrier-protein] synthase II